MVSARGSRTATWRVGARPPLSPRARPSRSRAALRGHARAPCGPPGPGLVPVPHLGLRPGAAPGRPGPQPDLLFFLFSAFLQFLVPRDVRVTAPESATAAVLGEVC